VVPPFGKQGMTVADMYTGFMKTPEEIDWWKKRLTNAQTGFYTPPSITKDTINLPSVNGGALFFSTGADAANGTVYVLSKDMPSIVKLVAEGQSTTANAGGLVPSREAGAAAPPARARLGAPPTPEQMGRAVYEQNCQFCHGPALKGDRGPALDTVVSRLGTDGTKTVITNGRPASGMPPFATLPADSMTNLLAFLKSPDSAPVGSAATAGAARAGFRGPAEPTYPADVEGPPSRYKTGYGNEPYIVNPPWSYIVAYDLNTGKIKWKSPYGDTPQAGPSDKLRGNVYPKAGFVITAGGLLLFAGNDSKLYAVNSTTGEVVFSKELPNGSQGVPAVYEANGREYVLVCVSGGATQYPENAYLPPGGTKPPQTSKGYIAFALPAVSK